MPSVSGHWGPKNVEGGQVFMIGQHSSRAAVQGITRTGTHTITTIATTAVDADR